MKYRLLLVSVLATALAQLASVVGCNPSEPRPPVDPVPATSITLHVVNLMDETYAAQVFITNDPTLPYEELLTGKPVAQVTATAGLDCKWNFSSGDVMRVTFRAGPAAADNPDSLPAFEHELQYGVDYTAGDRVSLLIMPDPQTGEATLTYGVDPGAAD